MNSSKNNEIRRLDFENILWIIFIILSILNIVSNNNQKEYVKSYNQYYEDKANNISIFVLSIVLLIYLYFFLRNYTMYSNKMNIGKVTNEDLIKVLGSLFFVIGTICLLYFQINGDDNFIGSPFI